MTGQQADILLSLIEVGTDGNWEQVKSALLEQGYTPQEIVDACDALSVFSGRSPMLSVEDF